MKNRLLFLTTLFTLVFTIAFTSCKKKNDDDITNNEDQNEDTTDVDTITDFTSLYDVILQADSFNLLVEAVTNAGLVETLKQETGTYTVFLPTDAAINNYLSENDASSIPDEVLLYHLIGSEIVKSGDFGGYQTTMSDCNGMLSVYISSTDSINGEVAILQKDVEADNGVIHVVDAVLELPSVMTFIKADPNLSLYYTGINYYDNFSENEITLGEELSSTEYTTTVFAPNNNAVKKMFSDYGGDEVTISDWSDFSSYDGNVSTIMYHMSDTSLVSSKITSKTELDAYYRIWITFDVSTEIVVSGEYESPYTKGTIINPDIIACNGVVHIIDGYLIEDYSQEQQIIVDEDVNQQF